MKAISARFKDPLLQEQYEDFGYVHIRSFLDRSDLGRLMDLFHAHYSYDGQPNTLWNSLCDIPHSESAILSDNILRIVRPCLEAHLEDFVCPAATFLVKNPTATSTVPLHRDFSVQDEPGFSYQNIWLPLVDTTPENGRLLVLPRSHHFFDYPLPHHTPWPYLNHERLLLGHCDAVDAKAGDLVIYSDKVLHGSSDNLTGRPRPVVHFGLLHKVAKLLYHYLDEGTGEVTVYEVPYAFFFENAWGNQDGRFPIHGKYRFDPPEYTEAEVRAWLESHSTVSA